MNWVVLALGVLVNATASILIKVSSMPPRMLPSLSVPVSAWATNWVLWLGVVAYGLAFVLYVYALSLFPASIAHPVITAGAIAIVATVAGLVLGESLSALTIVGIVIIISGVVLVALGSQGK